MFYKYIYIYTIFSIGKYSLSTELNFIRQLKVCQRSHGGKITLRSLNQLTPRRIIRKIKKQFTVPK